MQTPKTRTSKKPVGLPYQLAQALQWHQQYVSTFTKADDYIFCNGNGEPLGQNVLRESVLYPAYERANEVLTEDQKIIRKPREYGFHICRHSAGSLMIERTGDPTKAQRVLRHSKITTTVDTYGHVVGNADEIAQQQLADTIFPTLSLPAPELPEPSSGSITYPLPDSPEDEAVEELTTA